MKNVELLAPVGSMESLYAAVQNGANAVYLGGKLFNARHYASNFDFDELKEAICYAHLRGVKVYVTANILIDNSEMEKVIDYIKFLYEIDVDAVIVQDVGLAHLIKELIPHMEIHASTQMTINNLQGVQFLEDMKFSRVVLARETPLEEIKYIHDNTPIELEAFIHGALCVSYSGQCLMSSMIGGRSGNRGKCAQPCRMPSSIVDKNGRLLEDWNKKHILSTRDLNTIEDLDKIIDAGIVSLKIEGRMKRPEYVATIVKSYRKAIDSGKNSLSNKDKEDVEQIFNRQFTKGAMFGSFGEDLVSIDRPDNRGVLVGTVVRVDKYKIYVELQKDIKIGDGIEFKTASGEAKGLRSTSDGKKGDILSFEKTGFVLKDTKVFKTSSVDLLSRAKDSYQRENIIYEVDAEIDILIDKFSKLILRYKDIEVLAVSDKKTEKAKKTGLSREKIIEQISKLGDTNYKIDNIIVNLDENSFLPLSVLNKLRRDATDKLNKVIAHKNKRDIINEKTYNTKKQEFFNCKKTPLTSENKISIKVSNVEQLEQLDLDKVDRIYLDYESDLENSICKIKEKGKEVYLCTDRILYKERLKEIGSNIKKVENCIDGVSVSNLGSFKYIKDRFDLNIHGDMGLNLFNSYSLNYLHEVGIKSLTLSPELTLGQIKNINSRSNVNTEAIVYGNLPVMFTKHCPMSLVKGCKDDKQCRSCNFSKGYKIKDRMNVEFPMERRSGFSTIYNSVPLMVLDSLNSIYDSGINMARLDFTVETENIKYLQEVFYDFANGIIDINRAREIITEYRVDHDITNGHYFRGIM